MMDTRSIDFAVIGLGAVGAATLYQLAQRGAKVVGIDRHLPPHPFGSSHGRARLTRYAVGEGSAYVPLVRRSQEILGELERSFNVDLMERCGMLMIGSEQPSNGEDFVDATVKIAGQHDIKHALLSSADLRKQYPQLIGLADTDYGYFEPQSGFSRPEPIISVQVMAAQQLGATVITDRAVDRVSQENGFVTVAMRDRQIKAKHVAIAVGRWAGQLLGPPFDRLLNVTQQRTFSFRAEPMAQYQAENFPALMWFRSGAGGRCITAFPQSQGSPVSFFVEGIGEVANVEEAAIRIFERDIRPCFRGITSRMAASDPCFHTTTSDGGFIIDRHPEHDQILILSACSGHGFKHSIAVGELAANILLDEKATHDLPHFSSRRF